ncbi:MAG: hypothetical protein NTX71_03605 [Candidatus Aureabacteria bacterium]|nr:hypothetical protein [Candidatus Auribacterota bacterium]
MRRTLCPASALILASLYTGFAQPGPFAWPMFRYNAQHTGRSPYTGPPDVSLHWSYAAGTFIEF